MNSKLQDMRERNEVESGFGVGKRRYGLGRIMARLKETAESVIVLQFIVMNLEHKLPEWLIALKSEKTKK